MVVYKVVTKTSDPKTFLPWNFCGPGFNTIRYRLGEITYRQYGWGPLSAFVNFYDALKLYHEAPENIYNTPRAIIRCKGKPSKDRGYWGFNESPLPFQSMGESFYDSLYSIKEIK